ncbi:hypothetical protein [Streptococcus bouchesdurhonensis]|uniref:hypothetical protein n=1 Tax=Streptococcus bouchesdurhonensis TaxID=2954240 RepID=UPI0021C30C12|nr:hypothetical protein [Streptococcus bouchesdurhonensis]
MKKKDKNSEEYNKLKAELDEDYEVLESYKDEIDSRTEELKKTLDEIEKLKSTEQKKKIKPKLSLK